MQTARPFGIPSEQEGEGSYVRQGTVMNYAEVMALLPFVIIAVTAVVTMLTISIYRDHRLTASLSIAGLALAIYSFPAVSSFLPQRVTALLIMDNYAFFFMGLIFSATIAIALFAYEYLKKRNVVHEEFYLLLLLASLGAAVLVASSHFVSFFLGLETLSVSLYALLAYLRTDERGLEAAIKYLILAAVSSAFLLFGMALLYAQFGTMEFAAGWPARQAVRMQEALCFWQARSWSLPV